MTFFEYWQQRVAAVTKAYVAAGVGEPYFTPGERDEAEGAWDAATRAAWAWRPMAELEHPHAYDAPLTIEGKQMPATYLSDTVILTNGKRVWVERSVIMGGALSSSADKFTAYPSGDKPTGWSPLPKPPGDTE